ncbi:hypothetical protein R3W88_020070 [Solanum pinnatisectum]|uniref:Pre-mRNA-splicing factor SYF2 n=1 Tax=Solanum pinnatisectum TaxID=50273 RepID=A0AAV9KMK3_9SOLN|nr:hypothetical protein R3W88_020070 [Solanum pinnatisectum]
MTEVKKQMSKAETGVLQANTVDVHRSDAPDERDGVESHSDDGQDNVGDESANLITGRKKKLIELRLKMNEARKANQSAMVVEKKKTEASPGWDVFNKQMLYDAYKKRTKNVAVDVVEYNTMKETDPEFYREASSLQYGKAPKLSDDKIERMVKELKDWDEKRQSFSRRRKFHEEKDIDSINDRNEHFNKKIERAFGKYTLEIKNSLERGTALPD